MFQALDYMEEHLAAGSHVVLVGLIDAGFLYKVFVFVFVFAFSLCFSLTG